MHRALNLAFQACRHALARGTHTMCSEARPPFGSLLLLARRSMREQGHTACDDDNKYAGKPLTRFRLAFPSPAAKAR